MARLIISDRADADSDDIIKYLNDEAGRTTATKYTNLFDDEYERLAAYPESGSPRPRLGRNARLCVISPYVMIYDYTPIDDTVVILRILHGSCRVTPRLLRSR